jgi:hypothetical protein
MAELNPLRRHMIEDMKVRKSLARDATLLRARGGEIRPILRLREPRMRPALGAKSCKGALVCCR